MEQNGVEDEVQKFQVLPANDDEYGGVIVDMKESMDPNVFQAMLKASLSQWKLEGKKGAWIKLPIGLANLVEIAVKEGFWYHHAEPQYLMLAYWIPETTNAIPANATHQVRIGAVVMNDKRELLVVREKLGRFWGTGIWKIPTGILEEGEDIFAGATREVKEETGINTEFVDVIAFRCTSASLASQTCAFCARCNHYPSTSISKTQKLRKPSGCHLRNMQINLLSKITVFSNMLRIYV